MKTWSIIIYLESKIVWLTQAADKEQALKNVFKDKPIPKEGALKGCLRVREVEFDKEGNCLLT